MARVKRGVTSRAKHNKVFKAAKGFYGRRKNTIRAAKAAVDRSKQYAYRDRKVNKRNFRALWIQRINAAVREHANRLFLVDATNHYATLSLVTPGKDDDVIAFFHALHVRAPPAQVKRSS